MYMCMCIYIYIYHMCVYIYIYMSFRVMSEIIPGSNHAFVAQSRTNEQFIGVRALGA